MISRMIRRWRVSRIPRLTSTVRKAPGTPVSVYGMDIFSPPKRSNPRKLSCREAASRIAVFDNDAMALHL
jgi:hypothetical protein